MFRSGPLTSALLNEILAKVERHPHDLKAVARACGVYPSDLLAWYAAGQDPACLDPLMSELARAIAAARFERAVQNFDRLVAAANGGKKTKTVRRPKHDGESDYVETTVEDVLPAGWAVEKLAQMAAESPWEISPDAEQAAELHRMMAGLQPTALLVAAPEPGVEPATNED